MGAKYEVYRTEKGDWAFQLKSLGGAVILRSEGYRTFSGCVNGIESCREHSPFDRFYSRNEGASSFSFHVRASNNRVIAYGSEHSSAGDREAVISKVKRYAPGALIVKCTAGDR